MNDRELEWVLEQALLSASETSLPNATRPDWVEGQAALLALRVAPAVRAWMDRTPVGSTRWR